ncbi:hypothetical protein EUX98_g9638 [Antrodiella citrinella]|uniref:Uncharacterized protein n=1 Tax=Antrodiella citrinella TaxID=2447956 RepID=A0A4S4LPI3_9APHY|nr:hypothetical protein EUX98_g9638 [Antrodiella citrinella]
MCDKVVEVERALDDVRDMLVSACTDGTDTWRSEWVRIVQDVVKHDAGWNWETFWKMVLHVLQEQTLLTKSPHSTFPIAPPHLRPPPAFTLARIQACVDDFVKRDRLEAEPDGEVGVVVGAVRDLLARSSALNTE